jgi:hypothetical protein
MAKWHEVRTDGNLNNSAGFDKDSGSMLSDLTSSTGLSSSPIVSTNSYSFVASDIGQWLYVRTGTNWYPGWYRITGLSGTSAVVNAGIGSCVKASWVSGTAVTIGFGPAIYPGIGLSNSLSAGSWTIDYTQSGTAKTALTDLIVDTTVTRVFSPSYVFKNSDIANSLKIYAGTGWTLGIYYITGIAGTMAILNVSPGLAGTTGGSANLGGAVNHPNYTINGFQDGGVWIKAGTYTSSVGYNLAQRTFVWGYNTYRGDAPKGDDRPLITVTAPNTTLVSGSGANIMNSFAYLRVAGTGYTNVVGFTNGNSRNQMMFCKATDCITGFSLSNAGLYLEAVNCTTGISGGASYGCVAIGCTTGFNYGLAGNCSFNIAIGCTTGFATADTVLHNCVAYNCQTGFITNNLGSYYVSCIASTCTTYGFNINGQWNHRYISCASYLSNNATTNGYADWDVLTFLTQSPFVDPANYDFRLNDLPGGGALLKSRAGLGQLVNLPLSKAFDDVNIIQSKRQFFTPNMTGGLGG